MRSPVGALPVAPGDANSASPGDLQPHVITFTAQIQHLGILHCCLRSDPRIWAFRACELRLCSWLMPRILTKFKKKTTTTKHETQQALQGGRVPGSSVPKLAQSFVKSLPLPAAQYLPFPSLPDPTEDLPDLPPPQPPRGCKIKRYGIEPPSAGHRLRLPSPRGLCPCAATFDGGSKLLMARRFGAEMDIGFPIEKAAFAAVPPGLCRAAAGPV